ncbi:protein phosphatase [Clostridium cavendishii DSM 21758]|uniref:Protein phosphatase n=1 Tax=Clostridium cavendishii DSM 21758 TaxID=1121302 RepID=A0A1M6QIE2_9CLOT|nr:protein phosphatase 2C domain-containing protein [Clostridium cavendishii]SHK19787.1 protein phosphatase [Clostridium cavendishii DSM 21758]
MDNLKFHVGVASDIGNTKTTNQDSVLVEIGDYKGKEFGLFLVCDGLGGLSQGEIASLSAVKCFKEWWENEVGDLIKKEDKDIIESLEETLLRANRRIYKYSKEINSKIGTTVTALFISGNKYYIVNVGDSRIYRVDKRVIQETEDDSYVAMKVKNKEMTIEEAKNSKMKNILLQCVGAKENIVVYKKIGEIGQSAAFLLCSDGFYNKFNEKEMKIELDKLLKSEDYDTEVQDLAINMVQTVKNRKERDNISLILVIIEGRREKENIFSRLIRRRE